MPNKQTAVRTVAIDLAEMPAVLQIDPGADNRFLSAFRRELRPKRFTAHLAEARSQLRAEREAAAIDRVSDFQT